MDYSGNVLSNFIALTSFFGTREMSSPPPYYTSAATVPCFPLTSRPYCRYCQRVSKGPFTTAGYNDRNAGRQYFTCPCRPEPNDFFVFNDLLHVDAGNPRCRCGLLSRRGIAGPKSTRPGQPFFNCCMCACNFFRWDYGKHSPPRCPVAQLMELSSGTDGGHPFHGAPPGTMAVSHPASVSTGIASYSAPVSTSYDTYVLPSGVAPTPYRPLTGTVNTIYESSTVSSSPRYGGHAMASSPRYGDSTIASSASCDYNPTKYPAIRIAEQSESRKRRGFFGTLFRCLCCCSRG